MQKLGMYTSDPDLSYYYSSPIAIIIVHDKVPSMLSLDFGLLAPNERRQATQ